MAEFVTAEDDRKKVVSAIAHTETRSAICKLRRVGKLTADEAVSAMATLAHEITRMVEQPATTLVFETANTLVDQHNLRSLDAVQLASAIVARAAFQTEDMRFIASDHNLLAAAEAEGFPTWDPTA